MELNSLSLYQLICHTGGPDKLLGMLNMLGISVVCAVSSAFGVVCVTKATNSLSTESAMKALENALKKAEVLLKQFEDEDKLLRKILDRKHPQFVASLKIHVHEYVSDHDHTSLVI